MRSLVIYPFIALWVLACSHAAPQIKAETEQPRWHPNITIDHGIVPSATKVEMRILDPERRLTLSRNAQGDWTIPLGESELNELLAGSEQRVLRVKIKFVSTISKGREKIETKDMDILLKRPST